MKVSEQTLRNMIRSIIKESSAIKEEDQAGKVVISKNDAPMKIKRVLDASSSNFVAVWNQFAKNLSAGESAKVEVQFDIDKNGSVPKASAKVIQKSEGVGDTKDLTDGLSRVAKGMKFCGPDESFEESYEEVVKGFRFSI